MSGTHTHTQTHTRREREREGDRERETEREAEERGCRRPLKLERIQGREEENFGLMSGVLPFHGDAAEYENDPRVEASYPVPCGPARAGCNGRSARGAARVGGSSWSGLASQQQSNELKGMWQYRMMQRLYKREEKTDFGRKSRAFSGKITRDLSQGRLTRTDFTANMDMREASLEQSKQAAAAGKKQKSVVVNAVQASAMGIGAGATMAERLAVTKTHVVRISRRRIWVSCREGRAR